MPLTGLNKVKLAKDELTHELQHFSQKYGLSPQVRQINSYNGKYYNTRPEIVRILGVDVSIHSEVSFSKSFPEAYKDVKKAYYCGSHHPLAISNHGLHALAQKVLSSGIDPLDFENFVLGLLSLNFDEVPMSFY